MVPSPVRAGLLLAGLAGTIALADPLLPQATPAISPAPKARAEAAPVAALVPTSHPPVSRDASILWMAPSASERSAAAASAPLSHLQSGLKLYAQQRYELAVVQFAAAASPKSPLKDYGAYYAGVSELRLQKFEAARKRFIELKDRSYIGQAAALGEAEALQGLRDYAAEVRIYEHLLERASR